MAQLCEAEAHEQHGMIELCKAAKLHEEAMEILKNCQSTSQASTLQAPAVLKAPKSHYCMVAIPISMEAWHIVPTHIRPTTGSVEPSTSKAGVEVSRLEAVELSEAEAAAVLATVKIEVPEPAQEKEEHETSVETDEEEATAGCDEEETAPKQVVPPKKCRKINAPSTTALCKMYPEVWPAEIGSTYIWAN